MLLLTSAVLSFGDGLYQIDAQTGQTVGAPSEDDAESAESVRITSSCAYDMTAGMYVYTNMGPAGSGFKCSVYDGMNVRGRVTLQSDVGQQLKVYLNGEALEYSGDTEFADPGTYIVRDRNNAQIFSFTILNRVTNALYFYDVPSVFYVETVFLNDEPLGGISNRVAMENDGDYSINYFSYDTNVKYQLKVTVDHTPPVLELEGLNDQGYATNAVTLGKMENYSTVIITRDGEEIPMPSAGALTEAGDYVINYSDEAGNLSVYTFTIRPYLDLNAWFAVLIFAVLVIATGAFMIYSRTHMRVR